MMESTILLKDPKREIPKLFEAELKDSINDRASYAVTHKSGNTLITVHAKDIVALRATLNAITKQITVFEEMKKIM
jgi:tRNA threonylcarbamoyladenosine modification (KEOPS) complex  Pcc1 subunit